MKRRHFIKDSSLAMAGSLAIRPSRKRISALEKIQIGVIGCNGMGWANTKSALAMSDVDLVAICDVDQNVINKRLEECKSLRSNTPKTYLDYRELLQDDSIDAVIIGTPDHWHCLPMVDAVKAGKHVYVEKPIANTIEECQLMKAAAKQYGTVVQVGQWQRSGPHYAKAIDIVRSGVLGNIRLVKVWAYQGWMKPVKVLPDTTAPEGVDYSRWLGPAPKRPYNRNRFHFSFRWFWDYAGGLMTDWGVHEIDIALYAMNAIAPISVMASGGKLAYPNDASETPDTLQTVFQYDNFNMLWEHATGIDNGNYGRTEGIAFIGNAGTLVCNRQGYEIIPEKDGVEAEVFEKPKELNYLNLHTQNFVEAIKANDISLLNTPIESGSVAAINAQMGNIAYKTGRKVFWDKSTESFINDQEANELMKARYFNGYKLPTV